MPATLALSSIDFAARAVGVAGSGCMMGLTYASSSVIIPMIFIEANFSKAQRVALWNAQYDLSVQRWLPFVLAPGFLGYALAAFRTLRVKSSRIEKPISISSTPMGGGGGGGGGYFPSKSGKVLLTSAVLLLLFPVWTLSAIFPSVNKLKALHKEGLKTGAIDVDDASINALLNQWEGRHRVRIALAASAFGLGIWDLIQLILDS